MKQSFIVNILQQQNASWQGTVTWMDKEVSRNFRSVLELIRLIDSTLGEDPETDWKEASNQNEE